MCGLTGFVRHPNAPGMEVAVNCFNDLMVKMEHRGKHATGIAALGGSSPFTWKRAVSARTVVGSEVWNGLLRGMARDTTTLLGHVRYATQANGHKDEAAHPFTFGRVTGAHNGIIQNWRELERKHPSKQPLQVDSEIAFLLLDEFEHPEQALDLLDGYWALTWMKDGKFYVCRTHDAPLSMAYSGRMKTLFWNSEKRLLEQVMKNRGIDDVEVWEINSGSVYEYTPKRFTPQGTQVKRSEVKFSSKRAGKMSRQAQLALGTGGGWSETKSTPSAAVIADLYGEIAELKRAVQRQEAEIEFLYEMMNAAERGEDGAVDDSVEICVECRQTGGDMLELPAGGRIHEKCIFGRQQVRV